MKNFTLYICFLTASFSLNAQKSRLFFDAIPGPKDAEEITLHRYNDGVFMGNFKSIYFIDNNLNVNNIGTIGNEQYSFYNQYYPEIFHWNNELAFVVKIDSIRNSIVLTSGEKQNTRELPELANKNMAANYFLRQDVDTIYIPVSGDIMKYSTSKGYQSLREATGMNLSALPLFAHKGQFYFEHNKNLMVSDFTPEGTKVLKQTEDYWRYLEYYYEFVAVGDQIYFTYSANDTGEEGQSYDCKSTQLWSTQGTAESTKFIQNLAYEGFGDPDRFETTLLDKTLFYKANVFAENSLEISKYYAYNTETKTNTLLLENICVGSEDRMNKQIKDGLIYIRSCQGLSAFRIGDTKIEHELVIENNKLQKFEVYDSLILFTVSSEDDKQDILWMKNKNTNELTYIDSLGHLTVSSFPQTFGILAPNGKSIIYPKYTPNLGKELWIYDLAGANSIKEQTINFSLYPNPTKSSTQLELAYEANYTLELQNISGAVLAKHKFTGKSYNLNTNTLPAGMYLVKISNGLEQQVQKLVVN